MGYTKGIESQEFFDLMQAYRIASPLDQDNVVKRFEAVKEYIHKDKAELLEALKESVRLLKIEGWTDRDRQIREAEQLYQKFKDNE